MNTPTTIYLDHAATTAVREEVVASMLPFFTTWFGNASGTYELAQASRDALDTARKEVADVLGCRPREVLFTGGGTESDNLAILGAAHACRDRGRHLITTGIEHHAVLHTVRALSQEGWRITVLPVDAHGRVAVADVEEAIGPDTVLVSVMHANNEVGTLQPVAEIGALCRRRGVLFHTDAVQTFGHIPIDVAALQCDLLSLSAHKFHGPKGVGALYVRKGVTLAPLCHGGKQERGLRPSTENVPGIVGMGVAARLAATEMDSEMRRQTALRERLLKSLLALPDVRLNGHPEERLPNNVNVSAAGVEGEAVNLRMGMHGIASSTGSACTTGSPGPSHVLVAAGVREPWLSGNLRLTLGRATTPEQVDAAADAYARIVQSLRASSPDYRPGEYP
ncbi:MAG: cysteine desulfurase [Nitrospirota bacterium]|nr:cysteine desulfurase [Nitrospirota bacterium]